MHTSKARNVAFVGVLFALAVTLAWLETLLTPVLGLPPGVKIGLANCVVLYVLLCLSRRQALLLVALKAGFALLTRGPVAGALSAAGGLAGLVLMILLVRLAGSVLLVSVAGALGHNMGQLLALRVLFARGLWYYAPVLLLSGIVMGLLTAALLRAVLPVLQKAGAGSAAKNAGPPS